jgi:hypothetical protein
MQIMGSFMIHPFRSGNAAPPLARHGETETLRDHGRAA